MKSTKTSGTPNRWAAPRSFWGRQKKTPMTPKPETVAIFKQIIGYNTWPFLNGPLMLWPGNSLHDLVPTNFGTISICKWWVLQCYWWFQRLAITTPNTELTDSSVNCGARFLNHQQSKTEHRNIIILHNDFYVILRCPDTRNSTKATLSSHCPMFTCWTSISSQLLLNTSDSTENMCAFLSPLSRVFNNAKTYSTDFCANQFHTWKSHQIYSTWPIIHHALLSCIGWYEHVPSLSHPMFQKRSSEWSAQG